MTQQEFLQKGETPCSSALPEMISIDLPKWTSHETRSEVGQATEDFQAQNSVACGLSADQSRESACDPFWSNEGEIQCTSLSASPRRTFLLSSISRIRSDSLDTNFTSVSQGYYNHNTPPTHMFSRQMQGVVNMSEAIHLDNDNFINSSSEIKSGIPLQQLIRAGAGPGNQMASGTRIHSGMPSDQLHLPNPLYPSHFLTDNVTYQFQYMSQLPKQRPSLSSSGIGSQSDIGTGPDNEIDVDAEVDSWKSWIKRDPHQWTVSLF